MSFSGAFNITKEAEKRSQAAQALVDDSERHIEASKSVRKRVEDLVNNRRQEFEDDLAENKQRLDALETDVTELSGKLAGINAAVGTRSTVIEMRL